MDGVILYVVTF